MIKYTDLYVNTMARGLLNPGEQLVAAAAGTHQSFWTFNIPWFKHAFLLIATSDRLLVVDHRRGLFFDRVDAVTSYRWADISSLKLSGLLSKKLVVRDASNRVVLKMKQPPMLLNPLANNSVALRTVVQTWEQRRQLTAPATPFGLPAQGYPAPQYNAQQPFN